MEGTILLYKSYRDKRHPQSGKRIEIKPIKHLREQRIDDTLSHDNEVKLVEHELQTAKAELSAAKLQKEKLIQDAIAEINNEKQKWESEKQILKESIKEQGYKEGLELGKKESLDKYKQLLQEANSIIQAATNDYNKILDESDQTIAQLAVYIAEKIMKQSISNQPEQFLNIVKAAITEIKNQSTISIYLHPANYKTVIEQKEELKTVINGDAKISVYIDQGLRENSCLIEHPLGQVDASVDTQLEEIRNVLMEIAKESTP